MKKLIKIVITAMIYFIFGSIVAFAGEWKADASGWRYCNDDGTYPAEQWKEISGKQYYFDADGYMLFNTITPDGKQVGADGACISKTSASQKMTPVNYTADSITTNLIVYDYTLSNPYIRSIGNTNHYFEITNLSPYTIKININEKAKNSSGDLVGAKSTNIANIPSGCTIFAYNYFEDVIGVQSYDTIFRVKEENDYRPVIQNLIVQTTDIGEKIAISVTNVGEFTAFEPKVGALFFKNGEIVDNDYEDFSNYQYEIKSGETIFGDVVCTKEYDSVKVYIEAYGDLDE